jgi:quinoprotein glucose dehydrogenase
MARHVTAWPAAVLGLAALLGAQAPPSSTAAPSEAGRDWPVYGGTIESTRYSSLRQITRENVANLAVAWQFDPHEGAIGGRFQVNPIVIGGVIFTTTPGGSAIALDGATGGLKWSWNSGMRGGGRGVTYWSDGSEARILAGFGRYVYALDASTGKPVSSFGRDGRIDLNSDLGRDPERQAVSLTTPGVIYKDLYIVGGRTSESLPASPGDVRAYDARSGVLRWSFHTIPHPGEFGYETWPKDAWTYIGSANNWAGMAVDTARGIVYVPTGSAASDFYGANRLGDNLFANTLLALDAATGKRLWHFQAVRHDIWDRDFPSPPTLVTVRREGKSVDAVAQATKQGALFLFDRVSGTPLFPIEDRKVPASTVEGEVASAMQPFPTKPVPYARQRLTEDMLTTRTPEAHRWAVEQFRTFQSDGQFVPLAVGKETVVFPGFDGGAEWGGSALDPTSGVIYINANDVPWSGSLRASSPSASLGRQTYVTQCAACHGENLQGGSGFPALTDLRARRTPEQVTGIVRAGLNRMPAFSTLPPPALAAVVEYVLSGEAKEAIAAAPSPADLPYAFTGYHKFLDPDGYPAVVPPWGTLNAINLNTGEYVWKVPLGEYPELVEKGIKDTGSENYGGPIVTAGGLLLIGATNFDRRFRAFDKDTGKLLWESMLPNSANATPATYEINGKQYVVVPAFGGYPKPGPQPPGGRGAGPLVPPAPAAGRGATSNRSPDVGTSTPSGGAFVAFALK